MKKYLEKLLVLLLVFSLVFPVSVKAGDEDNALITEKEEQIVEDHINSQDEENNKIEEKEEEKAEEDSYEIKNYSNDSTNYKIIIDDKANLLTNEEEAKLLERMKPITKYGNVGFVTIDSNTYGNTPSFARNYSHQQFGLYVSSTLFVIDMQYRQIFIFNNGNIEKSISANKSEVITDNTFRYATRGDYYGCADETFREILVLIEGGKISEPMRHISNIVLSVALSILIGYWIVSLTSRVKKQVKLQNYTCSFDLKNAEAVFLGDHKVYVPPSSSSGGGSSGGGGGGGGGGGSGGGHGF